MGLLRAGLAIALMIAAFVIVGCGGSDSLQPPAPIDGAENIVRVGDGPAMVSLSVPGWNSRANLIDYVTRIEIVIRHLTLVAAFGPFEMTPDEPELMLQGLVVGEVIFEVRAYGWGSTVIGRKDITVHLHEGEQEVSLDVEPVEAGLVKIGIVFPEIPDPMTPPIEEGRPPIVTVPVGQTVRYEYGYEFELIPLNGRTDIAQHSLVVLPKDKGYEKYSLQDASERDKHWQFSVLEHGYHEREYSVLQCRGPLEPDHSYILWGWPVGADETSDLVELAKFGTKWGFDTYSQYLAERLFADGYSRMRPMGNQFGVSHDTYRLGYCIVDTRGSRGQVAVRVADAETGAEVPYLYPAGPGTVFDFAYTHFSPVLDWGRKYAVETDDPAIGSYSFWTIGPGWKDPYYPPAPGVGGRAAAILP